MSSASDRTAPPLDSPGTPDRWLVLFLVALSYFTLYAHRSLINYLKGPLMAGLAIDADLFGWAGLAFNLPYALAQIGVGYLGDRFRRRSVILCCLTGSALALAGSGFAQDFWQMVACRVLLGVAQAASVPAIASAIADSFTPRTRSTATGIYYVSYNLSLVLVGKYGGRIADTPTWRLPLAGVLGEDLIVPGWRMSILLFAAAGGLGAAVFWLLFREPPRTERDQAAAGGEAQLDFWEATAAVLRVRAFLAICAAFVLTSAILQAMQLWLPGYLSQRFKLSLEQGGFQATFWIQMATVAGLFAGGWFGDLLAKRRMAGRTLVKIAGLLVLVPALILVGTGEQLLLLAVPMLLYGFGVGLYQANFWPATFEVVPPAARSTAIGVLNVASGVFAVWCQPLVGHYEKQGGNLGHALAALAILSLSAAGILAASCRFLLPRDYHGPLRERSA